MPGWAAISQRRRRVKDFGGKVAVVTGAGGGIGRALARRCAREGMRVVLVDIDGEALARATAELGADGARTLAVPTDVSRAAEVEALAQRTLKAFGAVHLLFNNAGVTLPGSIWETTDADWEWVLGVDLWGVIHGVRAFMPIMLTGGEEGHIVNTASGAGLVPRPDMASYTVAKYGVVALSECLHHQLVERGAPIGVSVLCPGMVNTRILDAERNRPPALRDAISEVPLGPEARARWQALRAQVEAGMSPEEVADCAFEAIRAGRFYALTHPELRVQVRVRMEDILQGRDPSPISRSLGGEG
jgi:NAD(P)-dependent dehydrogenase (short-subunit alcohol dehydrogenase family)